MKAKQFLSLFLALLTVMTLLVSCGNGKDTETDTIGGDETNPPESDPLAPEIEEDNLGDVNFANVRNPVVTFFVRTGYEHEVWVEEVTDDPTIEASYWRTQTVQDRLGVTIAQINQAGLWEDYKEWNETLRNAVQTRSHDFDAAMIYAGAASSLAIEGCYLNLLDVDMISLEKPWWNQNISKEATVYGSLFFASGAIATSQLQLANVTWYNKDLYDEHFATAGKKDIYQVVRDGEWTIDYMYELTSAVWEDNDSNGEASAGDTVGLGGTAGGASGQMDSWIYALGCDLTKINESTGEPEACFYNEHTVQAFEKLVNLYSNNSGAFVKNVQSPDNGETKFENGKVMMQVGKMKSGSTYTAALFRYGLLPVPKFDADQQNYRAICESNSSLATIISTVEDDRLDMVAATMELTAAEAYKQVKPVYVEVVLKSQNSNSPEDAEMVDLILDSMVYSFGWIFSSTHMGSMGKAFRVVDGSRDLTQYYESNKSNYERMIDLLIDGYASVV